MTDRPKIIEKRVPIDGELGIFETRYFAETGDGFDGTAQGYGYKSPQKLYKAYWYYKNRGHIRELEREARGFLDENPDVKKAVNEYFSADNAVYAWKDGEELSFEGLIALLDDPSSRDYSSVTAQKLRDHKRLWKSISRIS